MEYNKMVNFYVLRALQGEPKNQGTYQEDEFREGKVNFWQTLDVRLKNQNLIPQAGGSHLESLMG